MPGVVTGNALRGHTDSNSARRGFFDVQQRDPCMTIELICKILVANLRWNLALMDIGHTPNREYMPIARIFRRINPAKSSHHVTHCRRTTKFSSGAGCKELMAGKA